MNDQERNISQIYETSSPKDAIPQENTKGGKKIDKKNETKENGRKKLVVRKTDTTESE